MSALGPNPSGLCMCGCGQPAPISKETRKRSGVVKGHPSRFIRGHKAGPDPAYIVDEAGCWIWQGYRTAQGYGYLGRRPAYRVTYERLVGPILPGLVLDHLCRNPSCVNPAHLEPVTDTENRRRGHGTKLTTETAAEVRAAAGTYREIGKRFGIDSGQVSRIKNRQLWADA